MKLGIVILAAGQGTRMKSALPKVLHPLAGQPMLGHVLTAAASLDPVETVIVHGHGADQVKQAFADAPLGWALQSPQLGTGHAVQQALPLLAHSDKVLILYGDVPLIEPDTLRRLLVLDSPLALLTLELDDPTGYGRIIRDAQRNVQCIVEQKDASAEQLAVSEVNTGIMAIDADHLRRWLGQLSDDNAQGEYYLTDIVGFAVAEGIAVQALAAPTEMEVTGVNDRAQLARLERAYQQQQAERLMAAGVSLADPARFDLRGELIAGQDVFIDVNVIIEGRVSLGSNVRIGANTVLRDCTIGDGCELLENCVIEQAEVGVGSRIGPFSRLRPGARLLGQAHVGNFVEIKNANVGLGSKVNHLTYVGDADIGAGVNVGAGTITCNYDGANKHRTVIGDNAFIGSNAALVAPVTIGQGATIGAGSVVSKEAPADALTLTRAKQTSLPGWQRPVKQKK